MNINKIVRTSIRMLICFLLTFIICNCNSEYNDPIIPQLTDDACKEANVAIFLNDERLTDASVQFTTSPDSSATRMVLSGVNPTDIIELDVMTTRNKAGFIIFEGEKIVNNVQSIKIEGFYRPYDTPLVRINISYMVLDKITSNTYEIPIEENSGLCYQKYSNMETASESDSLRFICKRINSELAKHLKSIAFRFESDGTMNFEYTTTKQKEFKQSFRYWISKQDWRGDNIIHIEQPNLFYECLLNALIPDENKTLGIFPYITQDSTATLFIHEYHNYKLSKSIVLIGDIHYMIYSYIYHFLPTNWIWTEEEKACFNLMMTQTEKFCHWSKPITYDGYPWAFATLHP